MFSKSRLYLGLNKYTREGKMRKKVIFLLIIGMLLPLSAVKFKPLASSCWGDSCRGYYYYDKGCWQSWVAGESVAIGYYGKVRIEIPYSQGCAANWAVTKIEMTARCPNFALAKAQEEPYPHYSETRYFRRSVGCFNAPPVVLFVSKMVSGLVPVRGWAGLTRYGNWNYDPLAYAYAP